MFEPEYDKAARRFIFLPSAMLNGMANLVFGVGIPGSGKTSLLTKFAEQNSYEYISIDEMKVEKLGTVDDNSLAKEIWYEARGRMKEMLEAGTNVVFDSTFSTRDRRSHFLGVVRTVPNVTIEALYFDIPLEHVLARNTERSESSNKFVSEAYIREAYDLLQKEPPSLEEDFDVLIGIDEAGAVSVLKGDPDNTLIKFVEAYQHRD